MDLLNGSLKYQIDLLYYSEEVIRGSVTEILKNYYECYNTYLENRFDRKMIINTVSNMVVNLGTLMFIYFIYYLYRNQRSLEKISRLIKT